MLINIVIQFYPWRFSHLTLNILVYLVHIAIDP